MRVCLTNLGCKLNQAELETLARELMDDGHQVVETLEEAELHLINTCTVTHRAARGSRKLARRGRRVDPALRTVLTGCYASEKPEEAAGLEGVDLVVTNDRKEHLVALLRERFPEMTREVPAGAAASEGGGGVPVPYVPLALNNTRALVKVEDGCNMRCAFCIIPFTRGPQRSRPLPEVVAEVDALARAGAREVVVTGVQISHYRWEGRRLYDLVSALLDETPVPRLRVTSIAPWMFDDRLLELFSDRRLCRHVHLSLQSGSNATLERMKRPYTAGAYRKLVERIRSAVPGMGVTTDVIVGFPGETEEELAESLAFTREMAFSKVHAFPYSVREGTEAAELPDHVPPPVRKERMARMLELAAELEASFARSQVGERLEVLWEERREDRWLGTADNYLRVELPAEEVPVGVDLSNRLTGVEIDGPAGDGGAAVARGRLLTLPADDPSVHGAAVNGTAMKGAVAAGAGAEGRPIGPPRGPAAPGIPAATLLPVIAG